jgi:uncharacterized spore protein YtfJ
MKERGTMTTTGTTTGAMTGSAQARELAMEAPRAEALGRTLDDAVRRMMDSVRPEGIFGAVVEREGVALIPCAEVTAGFGMGGGGGFGPATTNQAQRAEGVQTADSQLMTASGSGMGGGGGARGRPVAVVALAQGTARVLPVIDVTTLAIAALTTAGFVAFLAGQLAVSRSRAQRMGQINARSAMRFARMLRGRLGQRD